MSDKRYSVRVGLFVLIGLVLVAVLMLNFSRGIGLFQPKYDIFMRVNSVAGLRPGSAVYLSGIQVGNVASVELDRDNKNVLVHLEILEKFRLHQDARFSIEQIGVLGDQFVIINPGTPGTAFLEGGAVVPGQAPFSFQEVARSTTDLLKRFDQLGKTVEEAIQRVNNQVLDTNTLGNLSQTIANFEKVSERTLAVVDNAGVIVSNAGPALSLAFSNLFEFSSQLENLAMEVEETLVTNRVELNQSMKNLRDATASLKGLAAGLEAGEGAVGALLQDEQLRSQLSFTFSNLAVLSSNVNRYGLLYKPKQPRPQLSTPVYPGKSPFQR
jgi:phospholipid/cholesterol/gamma-HCH transport system substrate-binding protein